MPQPDPHPDATNDAIAIIGMAGRFPGAPDIPTFWRNLRDGVQSIRAFTEQELQACGIGPEALKDPTYVNRGAPLDDAAGFDASFFGYTPREAKMMDPQHRAFLECAYSALQDAGYDPEKYAGLIGVFGGVARNTYFIRNAETYRQLMDRGGLYEAIIGSEKDFPSTRVSYKLNLRGPSVNVQTACSTSGVALHLACQSLLSGESDMALAGGTRIRVPTHAGYCYVEGGIPSPDGYCRAFDSGANGCVYGSGVGIVVLKRLADALEDRDQIHALIIASAINNDGCAKIGFTAPSVDGQAAVIEEALAMADVDADTIDYVEAHGTGTTLGDPIEIAALTKAFRQSTDRRQFCAIGSVKTNIGHLDAGAGITGLIKAVLALKHGLIPPSLNFSEPNPQIDFANSPFFVNSQLKEWPAQNRPRRAGVSSFGLGGTNFHVILQQSPSRESSSPSRHWQLLTLSAKTTGALADAASEMSTHLQTNQDINLADAAYSLQLGRAAFAYRSSIVCSDSEEAIDILANRSETTTETKDNETPARQDAELVFMFPGQGAQHVDMARDLYEHEPVFREQLDRCAAVLEPLWDESLIQLLYPEADGKQQAEARLTKTCFAQPALFAVQFALAGLWQSWGIEPQAMIGHSVGEFTAAVLAGVLSPEDSIRLLAARGKLMHSQLAGAMLAVPLSEEDVDPYLSNDICLAACNAPELTVVSGPNQAIDALATTLKEKGIQVRSLHTSHAFHSRMMEPAFEPFCAAVAAVSLKPPKIPLVSSLTGTWLTDELATEPGYWARQMMNPVLFSKGLTELHREPRRIFLEVGPGQTLSTLCRRHRTNGDVPNAIASLRHVQQSTPDQASMLAALGQLWEAGVDPDWQGFYEGQQRYRISLPTYPFQRERFWLDPPTVSDTQPQASRSRPETSTQPAPQMPSVPPVKPKKAKPADRRAAILNEIKSTLSELSGLELSEIKDSASFLEMGFDSLFMTQANVAFQRQFEVRITFRQLFVDAQSPAALATYIDEQLPDGAVVTSDLDDPQPEEIPEDVTSSPASGESTTVVPVTMPLAVDDLSASDVIRQQLEIMRQQIAVLRKSADHSATRRSLEEVERQQSKLLDNLNATTGGSTATPAGETGKRADQRGFGPFRPLEKTRGGLSSAQQTFIDGFIKGYNRKTKTSKELTQRNRAQLADPRTVAGFRLPWKECVYPIVVNKSRGCHLWDVDGNKYVDVAMGFGVAMLGHAPPFVTKAVQRQLKQDYAIGPQTALAGEVAHLLREMTGMPRVAFCNTGSEAVLAAIRTARTVSGRKKIATFSLDYHGIFDEVLGRSVTLKGKQRNVPVAPGILPEMLEHLVVLDYGSADALRVLEEQADDIAAVLVEPVRTRQPSLQPREFLHALRELTSRRDIALVFDEMVTGFRIHPGGAQAYFEVQADIATYGKVLAGGLPIGAIAGKSRYLDALDGGIWKYGDDSVPEAGVTWFAGTFVRHPLALSAARAVLLHLQQAGPQLQRELNDKTERFAGELNDYFQRIGAPLRVQHFSSFFLLTFEDGEEFSSLFYIQLLSRGVHITQNRAAFLSTAHTARDVQFVLEAFKSTADDLMRAGFLPRQDSTRKSAIAPESQVGHSDVSTTSDTPITEGQQEIWLAAAQGDDVNCSYNFSNVLRLRGDLVIESLEKAIAQLVQRHDALRTVIGPNGNVQRIQPDVQIPLPLDDLSLLPSGAAETQLESLRIAEVTTPFDLVEGPLLRCRLIRLQPHEHLLFLTVHHIICDGYSSGVLFKELGALYSAACGNTAPTFQVADSYHAHARELANVDHSHSETYWLNQLHDPPPVLELPLDKRRPATKTFAAERVQLDVDGALQEKVARLAANEGCTVFNLLFAAFTAFVERLTGQRDMVIGVVAAGQPAAGQPNLVGHCVNLLPVRIQVDRQKSFLDHVARTQRQMLEAFDHQDCTFGTILRKMRLPRDPARPPLVSVTFNMDPASRALEFAGLEVETGFNERRYENFEWFFNILPSTDRLRLECTFNSDLFERKMMQLRLREFETYLRDVVENPWRCSCQASIVPENEQALLSDWNRTSADYPRESCLHELVAAQAGQNSHKVAVASPHGQLTYAQLEEQSNQLAHVLIARGAGPDSVVAVCLDRHPRLVVSLLACLKSGAAYLPLDPTFPAQRLNDMLQDSSAIIVVTEERVGLDVGGLDCSALLLDSQSAHVSAQSVAPPATRATDDDLAYLIYTSGSTGRPKGVEICHRAIVNLLYSVLRWPGLSESDVMLALATVSFDIAGVEIWLPLICGARIELASGQESKDMHELMRRIESTDVTVVQATPATLRMLVEAGWKGSENLKIISTGEALPEDLVVPLQSRSHQLWNMYGPTESTIWSTGERINVDQDIVTIGRPIANTQVFVLDEFWQPVPVGVVGELFVGGDGLARGYRNRAELTAERFIKPPWSPQAEGYLYRTGDRARFLPDGRLQCLGRQDHQLKIRGFRIEPAEIETRLAEHPLVRQCVVVAQQYHIGDQRLVACYTYNGAQQPPELTELRAHLATTLPEYMIPQHFVPLDALPLNANEKIDIPALRLLDPDRPRLENGKLTPGSSLLGDLDQLTVSLTDEARKLSKKFGIRRVVDNPMVEQTLNEFCRAIICRYLVDGDQEFRAGSVREISAQRRALSLRPAYRKFHDWMLSTLQRSGVLSLKDGYLHVLVDPQPLADVAKFEAIARDQCAGFEGTIEMLGHCSAQMQAVLAGEVPGVSVLFVDGQRDYLDQTLREQTVEHRDLRVYRKLAEQLVLTTAKARKIRILEIGGGGGMLTWDLAEKLRGHDVEYTFSDVGTSIVSAARRQAEKRGLTQMKFENLDITRDPEPQGFQLHSFDVVLALNVVHATSDIDQSLAQLKRLIKPQGYLCLIEYTNVPMWDHLIWGLTDGWWCFDDRYREETALIDLPTWEIALRQQGFGDVRSIPTVESGIASDGGLVLAVPRQQESRQSMMNVKSPQRRNGAPRDTFERQLCHTWESLLGVKPVGVDDDFFELGGHSLLAVRLMVETEKMCGKRLPLATLLQARTVKKLAAALRSDSWQPTWDSLVPLRETGGKSPLFLMHSHGGNVLEYEALVSRLGDDQPVYGLQARGLDGNVDKDPFMEDMAAHYVEEIKRLQPSGPYYLGGFCFGGLLALEAARQLTASGSTVDHVLLIQTPGPEFPRYPAHVTAVHRWAYRVSKRIAIERSNLQSITFQKRLQYLWQRFVRLRDVSIARATMAVEPVLNRIGIKTPHSMPYILESLAMAHERAFEKYQRMPYNGKVSLFRASRQLPGIVPDATLGWSDLLRGDFRVEEVQGHQQNMLSEPHVDILAERISAHLASTYAKATLVAAK